MSLQWRTRTKSRGRLERIKKRPKTDIKRRGEDIYHLLSPRSLSLPSGTSGSFSKLPPPVFPSLSLSVCSFPSWNYERGLWHTVSQISYPVPEAMNNSCVCVLCTLSLLACMTLEVRNKNISVDRSLVSTARECVKTIASLQGQNNTPQPNA